MDEKNQYPEIDFVVLGAGHANIAGHIPIGKVKLSEVCNKQELEQKDISSLGLFDNSTPNYTTYYPDVTAEDLNPTDDEFINPVFRLLSNVIVHKRHNPIEFPAKVLRDSMDLLIGQTINIDHETAVGNAIGSIVEVAWQSGYTTSNGVKVPSGINGRLKIDGKSNPRIARGILMDPPSIHSNSVTVRFEWKPSHTFEDTNEFYHKLGQFDEEGNMIRRIATKIIAYSETSLVSHGADPFAQLIKDGKIINPDMANSFISFSRDDEKVVESKYIGFDYKNELVVGSIDVVSNSATDNEDSSTTLVDVNNKQTNNQSTMKEKLLKLCLIMGISDEATLTEDNFVEEVGNRFKELKTQASDTATLQTKVDQLTEANATLTTEKAENAVNAGIGETALADAREKATAAYKLAKGEAADEDMLKVISTSNYAASLAFLKQFEAAADEEFAMECNDCKSKNVSRSSVSNSEEEEEEQETVTNKSDEEVLASLRNKKGATSASFIENEAK